MVREMKEKFRKRKRDLQEKIFVYYLSIKYQILD